MRPTPPATALDGLVTADAIFFAGSPIPTAELDAARTNVRVNGALCELLRRPECELVGIANETLVHPDDAAQVSARLREWTQNGMETSTSVDCRYLSGDGTTLHGRLHLTAIRDAEGVPERFYSQFIDDTDRREAVLELEQRAGEQAVVTLLRERALEGAALDDLLAEAVRAVSVMLDAEIVGYCELLPAGESYILRAGVGWIPGYVGATWPLRSTIREGLLAAAREEDVSSVVDTPVLRANGVLAGITVAVGDPRAPTGMLGAHRRQARPFDSSARAFLRSVAHVLAAAADRQRSDERARHESLHDSLTGLPNRALMRDRLGQALARLGTRDGSVAVLVLDVDEFGLVNDGHGHHAGDGLLREVATRLRHVIGPADTVARIGSDEFALLCEVDADERAAQRLAEQVSAALVRPFAVAGEPHFVSASVGVVVASIGGTLRGPEELLRDADVALRRAKGRGRGGYELFDPRTRAGVLNRIKVESELRHALEYDQLVIEYQPYFRLGDGRAAGIEALVRWRHPERGLLPPADFIPVAEESGLILVLGEWVLRRALADLAAFRSAHVWAADLGVTVNVSAKQVDDGRLAGTVAAALASSGVPPELLGMEITEGLLLDDSEQTRASLLAIKQLGVRLLLDDFGTGYSSLSYLSRFPVDTLKVDRAFVQDLADGTGGPIVAAIVGLAGALGLGVIAEGIETTEQAERLLELGCEHGQGFLLARPMPIAELAERLQ